MQGDRYRLSDLARAELEDLRAHGIEPTDDEIVEINALAREVETPAVREELARGRPFRAGDVWLWPFTLNAGTWFRRVGCLMPNPRAALAYALAHPCDELETIDERPFMRGLFAVLRRHYARPRPTKRDVSSWYDALKCRVAELDLAIAGCLEQVEEPDVPHRETDRGSTPGELSATMIATVGGDPAMWERQVSIGYLRSVLDTLAAQQQAGSGHVAPNVARATMALGMAVERIKERGRKDV